ncbi:hypothetical protein [uncultured Duncaniella sp.]|uniref:hypothetical protein n=1 Tax=uncultured Duncaniella sp. TaxID=2768039 RepID=UPI0025AF1B58|nr:hypothetical protein [uncultured Duncaniella sp.]
MNENKLTEEFWRDCDNNNFSKEATVLFYYLLYRYKRDRQGIISINPAALLSLIAGYTVTAMKAASEELQSRGYVEYTPANDNCTSGKYRFLKTGNVKKGK